MRQMAVPDALHVHFNGAGGNIGAGKYNDGSRTNRLVLAERVADGMKRAWENTRREPITGSDIGWQVVRVALPPPSHLREEELMAELKGRSGAFLTQGGASRLAWLRRCAAGHPIEVSCLRIGNARLCIFPESSSWSISLQPRRSDPDRFVAMAAYGDYGPWYIGTARAYTEGGYETEPRSSNVSPEVEPVLMGAIRDLLRD